MMKYKLLLKLLVVLCLGFCSGVVIAAVGAKGTYVTAVNPNGMPKKTVTKYVPVPMPGQLMPIHVKKTHTKKVAHVKNKKLKGPAAVKAANKKALQQPNSDEYINSIMTFDFMEGALYQVYCAPLRITDLQFGSNEHIVSVAAGDTMRWQVSKTFSGAGLHRYEHLVIKPTASDLMNSLVVTTDQHAYHLQLHATNDTYMASVKWRYPEGDGLVEKFGDQLSATNEHGAMPLHGVSLDRLDFGYTVDLLQGKVPDWMPTMVFNDDAKTYIQFPNSMQEAPALFVGTNAKNAEVVNYRVEGNYYIVDRVFSYAQLRTGQKDQTVVRIIHGNG